MHASRAVLIYQIVVLIPFRSLARIKPLGGAILHISVTSILIHFLNFKKKI